MFKIGQRDRARGFRGRHNSEVFVDAKILPLTILRRLRFGLSSSFIRKRHRTKDGLAACTVSYISKKKGRDFAAGFSNDKWVNDPIGKMRKPATPLQVQMTG
jgi:hypothetical protein